MRVFIYRMWSQCAQRYLPRLPRTREHIYSQDGTDVLFLFIKHVYYPAIGLSNCPTAELLSLWWTSLPALWTTGAGGLMAFPGMDRGGWVFPSPFWSGESHFLRKVATTKCLGEDTINGGSEKKLFQFKAHFCRVHTLFEAQVHFPGDFWRKSHQMIPQYTFLLSHGQHRWTKRIKLWSNQFAGWRLSYYTEEF